MGRKIIGAEELPHRMADKVVAAAPQQLGVFGIDEYNPTVEFLLDDADRRLGHEAEQVGLPPFRLTPSPAHFQRLRSVTGQNVDHRGLIGGEALGMRLHIENDQHAERRTVFDDQRGPGVETKLRRAGDVRVVAEPRVGRHVLGPHHAGHSDIPDKGRHDRCAPPFRKADFRHDPGLIALGPRNHGNWHACDARREARELVHRRVGHFGMRRRSVR
jgi:hypothetical protein